MLNACKLWRRLLWLQSPDMSFSDFTYNLTGFLQSIKHLCSFLPPLTDVFTLAEKTLNLLRLVQTGHQLTLKIILDKVHHKVHHGLNNNKVKFNLVNLYEGKLKIFCKTERGKLNALLRKSYVTNSVANHKIKCYFPSPSP